MVTAMAIKEIEESCKRRYKVNEKRIVAIIVARYDIPNCRQMIEKNYTFWHSRTGKALDFFWLGYGSYNFHIEKGQYLVGDYENEPHVFFDSEAFCRGIEDIERLANFHYDDSIGILLCSYRDESLYLNESTYFEIESLMQAESQQKLREFTSSLIKECKHSRDITYVTMKLRVKKMSYGLLNIKFSDFVSTGIRELLRYYFIIFF